MNETEQQGFDLDAMVRAATERLELSISASAMRHSLELAGRTYWAERLCHIPHGTIKFLTPPDSRIAAMYELPNGSYGPIGDLVNAIEKHMRERSLSYRLKQTAREFWRKLMWGEKA